MSKKLIKTVLYEKELSAYGYYAYEYRFVFNNTSIGGQIENEKQLKLRDCRKIAKDSVFSLLAQDDNDIKAVKDFDKKIHQKELRKEGFIRVDKATFTL